MLHILENYTLISQEIRETVKRGKTIGFYNALRVSFLKDTAKESYNVFSNHYLDVKNDTNLFGIFTITYDKIDKSKGLFIWLKDSFTYNMNEEIKPITKKPLLKETKKRIKEVNLIDTHFNEIINLNNYNIMGNSLTVKALKSKCLTEFITIESSEEKNYEEN